MWLQAGDVVWLRLQTLEAKNREIIYNYCQCFWFGVELYSCLCWWVQLWGVAGEQCLRDPCRAEDPYCQEPSPYQ